MVNRIIIGLIVVLAIIQGLGGRRDPYGGSAARAGGSGPGVRGVGG